MQTQNGVLCNKGDSYRFLGSEDENDSTLDPKDDDSNNEESDEEPQTKNTEVTVSDVKMVDAFLLKTETEKKAEKTHVTPETTSAKILSVCNLSDSVQRADLEYFFKDAGEVVDVHFSTTEEGMFRGLAHVELATVQAAMEALDLNGQDLLGRAVRIAYMDVKDGDSFNQALELSGVKLGEHPLSVEEAKSQGGFCDGGGGSGRGHGTPNKCKLAAVGSGKKSTFDD